MSASQHLKWLLNVKIRQYPLADDNLVSVVTSFLSVCDICGGDLHFEFNDDNDKECKRCLSHASNCPQGGKCHCDHCDIEICEDCLRECLDCRHCFCQVCRTNHEVRCQTCDMIVCQDLIKICGSCGVDVCTYCYHHYIKCNKCGDYVCRDYNLMCCDHKDEIIFDE